MSLPAPSFVTQAGAEPLPPPHPIANPQAVLMGPSRFDRRRPERATVRVGCIAEIRQIGRDPCVPRGPSLPSPSCNSRANAQTPA